MFLKFTQTYYFLFLFIYTVFACTEFIIIGRKMIKKEDLNIKSIMLFCVSVFMFSLIFDSVLADTFRVKVFLVVTSIYCLVCINLNLNEIIDEEK